MSKAKKDEKSAIDEKKTGEGSLEGDERIGAIRNDIKTLKEQIETL